jgi:uncharacterized DUF497 family protein
MTFTWDARKDALNRRKHRVGFREAASVLHDPLSTTFPDPDHSRGEQRYVTIGRSSLGKTLVVAHAERGDMIRIITARPATRRERRFYEEA